MYICRYPHLFSAIRLGDTVFRNRLFAAPVGYEHLSSKNYPLDETIAFYERRAVGGAATVNVGSAVPDSRRGCIGLSNLYLDDPTSLPSIYRLASAIYRHGAVAAIELQHSGANSYLSAARGTQIYGAVDGTNALGHFVPAMPEEVIEETIEAYGNAAAFAKFCGFGMVTIHAGHGWLLSQFLDPAVNDRKDQWGGSLANRCRFALAIVDRIKHKCGRGFPVDIRISGAMCYEGGYGIDEGVAIAKQFDGKVDLIHVSVGSHEVAEVFTVTHPSMFLPDGPNVQFAAEVKKHVTTPVGAVGALGDAGLMEEVIASGKADVVLAARALMADPDFPRKARAGKADEIRPCIRCFECFAGITTKRQYRCAVNPEIGFEQDTRHALPAASRKRVLVAGGGVAGMQAALTAAGRGHEVILCEKSDRLGGVLRCEDEVPFKRLLRQYMDYQRGMLLRAPVEVRLDAAVTPGRAAATGADVIIAALGARAAVPPVAGIDGSNVLSAEDAYLMPRAHGPNDRHPRRRLGGHRAWPLPCGAGPAGDHPGDDGDFERWGESCPRTGAHQRDEVARVASVDSYEGYRSQRKRCHRRICGQRLHLAALSHRPSCGPSVEQLRPGGQGRGRGRQPHTLRSRYRHLRHRQEAASGRSRCSPFLRAGVLPDRGLSVAKERAGSHSDGFRSGAGSVIRTTKGDCRA